jgi:lysosomal Pro-X carboxypeptidase
VIFSTGELDPWKYGCVTEPLNDQTLALLIADGAHCTDLATPRETDPLSIKNARSLEVKEIRKWMREYS